jgi:hypothetical protein
MHFVVKIISFGYYFISIDLMSKNPSKQGVTAGKSTPGAKVTPGATATGAKGPDPKHLPREFK